MDSYQYLSYLQDQISKPLNRSPVDFLADLEWAIPIASNQTGISPKNVFIRLTEDTIDQSSIKNVITSKSHIDCLIGILFINPFIESLPENIAKSLKPIFFATLPIKDPNSQAIRDPHRNTIIIIDNALPKIIYYYIETMHIYSKELTSQFFKAVESMYEDYRLIIKYFRAETDKKFQIPKRRINTPELHMIVSSTIDLQIFIIAHELAHIFAGHMKETTNTSLKTLQNNDIEVNFFKKSQQQEFEADEIAMSWLISIHKTPKNEKIFFRQTSPINSLSIFNLLQLVETNLGVINKYSAHPSAITRIEKLLSLFWNRLSDKEKEYGDILLKTCLTTPKF